MFGSSIRQERHRPEIDARNVGSRAFACARRDDCKDEWAVVPGLPLFPRVWVPLTAAIRIVGAALAVDTAFPRTEEFPAYRILVERRVKDSGGLLTYVRADGLAEA